MYYTSYLFPECLVFITSNIYLKENLLVYIIYMCMYNVFHDVAPMYELS